MQPRLPFTQLGRGGPRPGAGRPRTGRTHQTVPVKLDQETINILERRANKLGLGMSTYLRILIENQAKRKR